MTAAEVWAARGRGVAPVEDVGEGFEIVVVEVSIQFRELAVPQERDEKTLVVFGDVLTIPLRPGSRAGVEPCVVRSGRGASCESSAACP